jgi:hypothetical protein
LALPALSQLRPTLSPGHSLFFPLFLGPRLCESEHSGISFPFPVPSPSPLGLQLCFLGNLHSEGALLSDLESWALLQEFALSDLRLCAGRRDRCPSQRPACSFLVPLSFSLLLHTLLGTHALWCFGVFVSLILFSEGRFPSSSLFLSLAFFQVLFLSRQSLLFKC